MNIVPLKLGEYDWHPNYGDNREDYISNDA
jgi:hypothetical protein